MFASKQKTFFLVMYVKTVIVENLPIPYRLELFWNFFLLHSPVFRQFRNFYISHNNLQKQIRITVSNKTPVLIKNTYVP